MIVLNHFISWLQCILDICCCLLPLCFTLYYPPLIVQPLLDWFSYVKLLPLWSISYWSRSPLSTDDCCICTKNRHKLITSLKFSLCAMSIPLLALIGETWLNWERVSKRDWKRYNHGKTLTLNSSCCICSDCVSLWTALRSLFILTWWVTLLGRNTAQINQQSRVGEDFWAI